MFRPNQFLTGLSYRSRAYFLRYMIGKEWKSICPIGNRTNCLRENSSGECCMGYIQIELRAWFHKQRLKECPSRQTFKIKNGDFFSSLKSSTSSSNMTLSPVSIRMHNFDWQYSNIAKKGRGASSIVFSQVSQARTKKDKRRKVAEDQMIFDCVSNQESINGNERNNNGINIQNPRKNNLLEEVKDNQGD